MAEGTLAEAMRVMEGQLVAGDPATRWSGAAVDSRRVSGQELFFALPGERTDGHRFVADALARGAAAAIVHEPVERPERGGLIEVGDAFGALHLLTRHVRQRLPESLVGVTGSAGKTTTKELLAKMLGQRYRAAGSPGNLNNLYGFPLALLSIPEETEWMVAEMGMSTPGELSQVSRLGRPDAVVLTNVRAAHLEFFGSLREIGDAKAEILDGLRNEGLVVANADDPEVMRIAERHSGPVVTFALGVSRNAVVDAVREASAEKWRGQIHRSRGATIVDDSYNSNPAALEAALKSARELPGRRYWAILGAMLELGDSSARFHEELGARAVSEGFSAVLGVGEEARALVESVQRSGGEGEWFASAAEAAPAAAARLEPGDVVLVKGSRGIGLEATVEYLLGEID